MMTEPPDNPAAEKPSGTNNQLTWHRPVLPLVSALIAGILLGRYFPDPRIAPAAWLIAVTCLVWLGRSLYLQRTAAAAPVILIFVLGWISIYSKVYPAFPPESVRLLLDGSPAAISGTVSEPPVHQGFRTRLVLSGLSHHQACEHDENTVSLPGRIQLTVYGEAPEILPGFRISFTRPIRSIRNFNNPGGFDYRQFMAWRSVWGTAWINGRSLDTTMNEDKPARPVSTLIYNARISIDQAIDSVSTGDSRAVLSALVVGKRDHITHELRESFSRAGVSHLLAISGLHVGIVATICFLLLSAILGRVEFLLRRALVKKTGAVLSIVLVIGYGMLAGMSPSTQRAVIMIVIFLAAFLLNRSYNPANTLAAAALGILMVYPHYLFDISFQLSFAAVSAIFIGLYLFPPAGVRLGETKIKRFFRIITGFIWISVFAIIGTMPLVAHYFNQVSILGIGANLILVPLVGFVVVPLGLVSALFHALIEPLGRIGFMTADILLRGAIGIAEKIAALPFGAWKTVTPSAIEMICIYSLLIAVPVLLKIKADRNSTGKSPIAGTGSKHHPHARQFTPFLPAWALRTIAAFAALILIADIGYWTHRRFFSTNLVVTHLDVGQGNAALVELPRGETILIDGGGFSDNSTFDVGAMVVAPYLWRNKIASIDKVVLSHPHSDHLNGLLYILEHFSVGKVISTHFPAETTNYQRFLEIIEERGIEHPDFAKIGFPIIKNGYVMDILYPPGNRRPEAAPANLNDGSIVVRLEYGNTSFLFPGDVERAAEAELVALAGDTLRSDILLAPHHGSQTSSTPEFLDAINPGVVVVSARSGRFDFPAESVIKRYEERGFRVYTTEINGAVRIRVDKKRKTRRVIPTIRPKASAHEAMNVHNGCFVKPVFCSVPIAAKIPAKKIPGIRTAWLTECIRMRGLMLRQALRQ